MVAARLERGRKHGLLPKCILHWVMLSIVRFGLKEKDKLLKIDPCPQDSLLLSYDEYLVGEEQVETTESFAPSFFSLPALGFALLHRVPRGLVQRRVGQPVLAQLLVA